MPIPLIGWLVIGFLGIMGISVVNNLVASMTGHSPMAETVGTLMQSLLPMIITLMPIMMIMNMFMSMIQGMMAPITTMARMIPAPSYPVY